MQKNHLTLVEGFEPVLARHLTGLLQDLRNYEAVHLIALIQMERLASLRTLVEADCEEHFRLSTMKLGEHTDAHVSWDAPPKIEIGMVFRNWGVELHFRLMLEAHEAGVEIDLLRFRDPLEDMESQIVYLQAALADARRHQP